MNRYIMNASKVKSPNAAVCILVFAFSAQLFGLAWLPCARAVQEPTNWKAGIASTAITPDEPMWMAGYAARNKPSEGKIHDLNAKVLILEDAQSTRLVIVTVDLIGIPARCATGLKSTSSNATTLPQELCC